MPCLRAIPLRLRLRLGRYTAQSVTPDKEPAHATLLGLYLTTITTSSEAASEGTQTYILHRRNAMSHHTTFAFMSRPHI